MHRIIDHLFIFFTIFFTVYSQLIMRWQVGLSGQLPSNFSDIVHFILTLLFNPWIFSGIIATFFAGISWMLAMTRFEISYAFPFVSLNYVLILSASILLFNETFTITKLIGTFVVIVGILVIARG